MLENLPSFLSIFQSKSLPEDLDQVDYKTLAESLKWVSGADRGVSFDDDVCPFPGLEAFSEDDAPFFFRTPKRDAGRPQTAGLWS
jgi:hypothetical protein